MMDEDSSELRRRGIEFFLAERGEDKKPYEFSAMEIAAQRGIAKSSVYEYMSGLVAAGKWKMRDAYDPETHKTLKVWWMSE